MSFPDAVAEIAALFVFERSFWTVAAGLGTALAIVALSLVLDRPPSVPGAPVPGTAGVQAPAGRAPATLPERHDISLAKR